MLLKKLKKSKKKGFTIIEIVIVIFIIALSMVGIMSLVIQNMQVEYINKNMLIASQLVQEGLELVRNVRDNNWLADYNWKTGDGVDPDTDIIGDQTYAITLDTSGITSIDIINVVDINDSKAKLYIDDNDFYVNLDPPAGATSTIFSRIIEIKTGAGAQASTTVECVVKWSRGTNNYKYSAQTVLYNWR